MSRTIVFDISPHGFGHLGQVAPIIRKLSLLAPTARIIVRNAHPAHIVTGFVGAPVELHEPPREVTLVSTDPTTIDSAASALAYRELHHDWRDQLELATQRLAALAPHAVVANIGYISLAAAARLGIPGIALGSLNWLDLYRAYCASACDETIVRTIKAAYDSARCFLQLQPHIPMPDLCNRRSIGPVARIGRHRGQELRARLGIARAQRLVLVTLGGIRSPRPLHLPKIAGVHWLLGSNQPARAVNATEVSEIDMDFADLLASCDCVVTKLGYATVVEAACNGIAFVSADRADWPESRGLIEWARQNAAFELAADGIEDPRSLETAVVAVLGSQPRSPVSPSGVLQAVEIISEIAGLALQARGHG